MLVDTGVAEAADHVIAAYKAMTPMPLRWIINTSVDRDHTEGNEEVAKTGLPGSGGGGGGGNNPANAQQQVASILAHEAVRIG